MYRIGNNPIPVPSGVTVTIENNVLTVKGKLGELSQAYEHVEVTFEDNELRVARPSDSKLHRTMHGLYRSLVNNMVKGVSEGFEKQLELVGVGYRATNVGQKLDLSLGFSHNIV